MKQYGLRIKRKNKDGSDYFLEVYHLPLSYMDWAVYSGSNELFDPATVRYLLYQYVVRVVRDGVESDIASLTVDDMSVIESVVNNIVKTSVFHDPTKFTELITILEEKSRTLLGCYDLFIFQQLGAEFYLRALEMDAYTRAHLIMMLEKSTGIFVKERFNEAIDKNIPLDLLSSPDQYKRAIKKHGMSVPNRDRRTPPLATHREAMPNEESILFNKDKLPSNINSMLSEASQSLSEALNAGRKKAAIKAQKQPFDWKKDQSAFDGFSTE